MRLKYTKAGRLRWLGHLDFARGFERALRRSKLAVAYSKGFNPHIRLSFAHPLPLGFEGLGELCAVELDTEVVVAQIAKSLRPQLCQGIALLDAQILYRGRKSPFAEITVAEWELALQLSGGDTETATPAALEAALDDLLAAESISVQRVTKSRTIDVDIRPHIHGAHLSFEEGGSARLSLELGIAETQVAKPDEVVKVLSERLPPQCRLAVRRVVRRGLR